MSELQKVLEKKEPFPSQRQQVLSRRRGKDSDRLHLRAREDADIVKTRETEDRDLEIREKLVEEMRIVCQKSSRLVKKPNERTRSFHSTLENLDQVTIQYQMYKSWICQSHGCWQRDHGHYRHPLLVQQTQVRTRPILATAG